MLKFEFDEEKQKIFLNFWKVDKIDDFSSITANPDLFFLRFCLLNDVALKLLGRIIQAEIISGKSKIKDYPPLIKVAQTQEDREKSMPLSTGEEKATEEVDADHPDQVAGEIMEMLDSVHLINLWDSSQSSSVHALSREATHSIHNIDPSQCHSTAEFKACFQFFARPPFSDSSADVVAGKNLPPLTREEKKVLSHFLEFYGFTNNLILLHHSEEALIGLKDKGYIDFFFLSRLWIPAVVVNPAIISQQMKGISQDRKAPDPLSNPFPKEELAESLFFLQLLEYEQAGETTLTKYHPTSQEKKKFLEGVFRQLSLLGEKGMAAYQSLNFAQKIIFLMKKTIPSGHRLLEILLTSESIPTLTALKTGISQEELTYEINRHTFLTDPTAQELFSQETVKDTLHAWVMLGLLIKKQNLFYGEEDILLELGEVIKSGELGDDPGSSQLSGKTLSPHPIVIDSDYTLIATKEQLRAEEIYFLYHFCSLKVSPHLVRGQLDSEKSSLAWYFGLDKHRLTTFFKDRSGATWQKNFQEMLELYFEHTPYFKVNHTIKLTSPSKNFFLLLKYFLEEKDFLNQVIIMEKERIFIFHEMETFQKVREAFPDPAPVKFFEKR